jgi:hypothetical protein
MNILHRPSVPALVFRSFASMMVSVFLLASCSSQREVWQDIEVSSGRHEAGSALDSDYLVRRGATLHADYANGSRFYVESGGSLVGLRQGIRECTAYAESGALIQRRDGLKVIPVPSARRAYADRDKPVFLEKGPGGFPASAGRASSHDDDDDDDHNRHLPSNVRDIKISKSSYRKKGN